MIPRGRIVGTAGPWIRPRRRVQRRRLDLIVRVGLINGFVIEAFHTLEAAKIFSLFPGNLTHYEFN